MFCWLTSRPLSFSRNLEIYLVSRPRVVADDLLADPPSSFTDRLDWVSDCQASIIRGVHPTLQTTTYKIYFVFLLNTKHLQMGQTICGIVWGGVSLYSIPGGIVPSLGGSRKSHGGKPHARVHSGGKSPRERELADSQMCHLLVTTTYIDAALVVTTTLVGYHHHIRAALVFVCVIIKMLRQIY